MNDHTSDVYLVATRNDISKLRPEFARAERFDGVFFLNLPDAEQRRAIWNLYLGQFELAPDQKLPNDEQWTGGEIRTLCGRKHKARLTPCPTRHEGIQV